MKKTLFLLICFCLLTIGLKAQGLTTESNYIVTYKIKLAEVTNAISAKEASLELQQLFDSDLQKFDSSNLEITIKSVFYQDEAAFATNLLEVGYTLTSFVKTMRGYPLSPEPK